jgi:hypothetical protein
MESQKKRCCLHNLCEVCKEDQEDIKALHKHLKSEHSLTQKKYYTQCFPKKDPFSGEEIEFFSFSQYSEANYTSVKNFISHIKSSNQREGNEIILDLIERRAKRKGIDFAPNQVESISLPQSMPPFEILLRRLGNIKQEFERRGLKLRYDYFRGPLLMKGPWEGTICIDTREQDPLLFDGNPTQLVKLNYGDYANPENEKVVVERKSLGDFIGTLSGGFDRFRREITRGLMDDAYFVVVVEESLSNSLNFHKIRGKSFSKCSGSFIFHKVRDLTESMPNVQFLFVDDRKRAEEFIRKIFYLGDKVRTLDLQYMHDNSLL